METIKTMNKLRGIRYYIGKLLCKINNKIEDKTWSIDVGTPEGQEEFEEKLFHYLGHDLYRYMENSSHEYARIKSLNNEDLYTWYYYVKFASMYMPEKIYRLFCDLFKFNY